MEHTYTFSPTIIGEPMMVTVGPQSVKDGTRELAFADLTEVRWVVHAMPKVRSAYFELHDTRGQQLRLSCTSATGTWGKEPDSKAFIDAVATILDRLIEVHSDLPVQVQDSKGWRWVWFAIGASTLAFAVGIVIFAIMDGVQTRRLLEGLPLIVMLGIMGAFITLAANPRSSGATVASRVLRERLDLTG